MSKSISDLMIVIVGPTAVGKTELSIELAKKIGAEIISADSRQVYRFMDIGTAKPSFSQLKEVPHHMIDTVNPDERYSVGDYKKAAEKAIQSIFSRRKVALLVGGSGLYIRAVINGIFDGPGANPEVRTKLEKEAGSCGIQHLYDLLKKLDPAASRRIHPNDKRRIIRALEIYEITGEPISKLQEKGEKKQGYNPLMIGLNRPRAELYRRIDERVERILRDGFIEEVKGLLEKGYGKERISSEAIGYREIIDFLEGKINFREMKEKIKVNTHGYARRQLTWFRKDKRINWIQLRSNVRCDSDVLPIITNKFAEPTCLCGT